MKDHDHLDYKAYEHIISKHIMHLPQNFNFKLNQQSFEKYEQQLNAAPHGVHEANGFVDARKRLEAIKTETHTANELVVSKKNEQFELKYQEAMNAEDITSVHKLTAWMGDYCNDITTQLWINVAYADQKMKSVLHSMQINVSKIIDHDRKTKVDFPIPSAQFEYVLMSRPENEAKLDKTVLMHTCCDTAFVLMSVAAGKATELYGTIRHYVIVDGGFNQVEIIKFMQDRFTDEATKRHRHIYEYIQNVRNLSCNTSSGSSHEDDAETLKDEIFSCVEKYAHGAEKMINEYVKEFADDAIVLNYEYEQSAFWD